MRLQRTAVHVAITLVLIIPAGCQKKSGSPEGETQAGKETSPGAAAPTSAAPAAPKPFHPKPTAEPAGSVDGQTLTVAGVIMTVPKGWNSQQPSSGMRAAQYELPGDAGTGELVVYYFGKGQGGPADLNIKRWIGQLKNPTDPSTPAESQSAKTKQNGLDISVVTVFGTYAPQAMGPAMPAKEPQENYALYGAVIEGSPQGSVFVKATGPRATMDPHKDRFDELIRSAKLAGQ